MNVYMPVRKWCHVNAQRDVCVCFYERRCIVSMVLIKSEVTPSLSLKAATGNIFNYFLPFTSLSLFYM